LVPIYANNRPRVGGHPGRNSSPYAVSCAGDHHRAPLPVPSRHTSSSLASGFSLTKEGGRSQRPVPPQHP
jgi:hypothetical protein